MRRAVRFVVLRHGIERAKDGELEQRGICRNRRLDRVERDRLRLRAELGVTRADLAFEPLLLSSSCAI
jgi:hypothetical protein